MIISITAGILETPLIALFLNYANMQRNKVIIIDKPYVFTYHIPNDKITYYCHF